MLGILVPALVLVLAGAADPVTETYQVGHLVSEGEPTTPQPVEPLDPVELVELIHERLCGVWSDDCAISIREGGILTVTVPRDVQRRVREILEEVRITRR